MLEFSSSTKLDLLRFTQFFAKLCGLCNVSFLNAEYGIHKVEPNDLFNTELLNSA